MILFLIFLPELAGRIKKCRSDHPENDGTAPQRYSKFHGTTKTGIGLLHIQTSTRSWNWFWMNQQIFDPDTRTSYSNTNYLLIGRILDNVLGYSHHQYIDDEILAPLGLTNTYSLLSQVEYVDVVSGYWYGYDDDLRNLDHVIPGGSMIATAEDVGIFLRALNDGSLLNEDEQTIYSSIYEYEHTGWVPGYYSIARYYADIDTVVIQFVNTTGGDTWGLSNVTGGKALGISNIIYNRIVRILKRQ